MILNPEQDGRTSAELVASLEKLQHPEQVCLTGITHHPTWGEFGENKTDRLRGDQTIANFEEYVRQGYSVVIIDGESSLAFLNRLNKIKSLCVNANQKVEIRKQNEKGYGQARREGFLVASSLSDIKALVQVEFEKPLINSIPALVSPIIKGEAQLTISDRQIITRESISNDSEKPEEHLRGLPRYQARSEAAFNLLVNKLLRLHNFLKENEPDIDFMGNRAWKNDPEINALFLYQYQLKDDQILSQFQVFKHSLEVLYEKNPDKYSSALFFPVIEFLFERFNTDWKFASVKVRYNHPSDQSNFENENEAYISIRDKQRENIFTEVYAFIKSFLEEESPFQRNFQG